MTAVAIDLQDEITQRLAFQEQRAAAGFQQAAAALTAIRDDKLYRYEYSTWQEYLQERWQKSRSWFSRIMQASEIVATLPNGDKIQKESHARALRQFDQRHHETIVDIAAANAALEGKPLAARHIERVGTVLSEAARTGAVDTGDGTSTPFTAAITQEQYETMQRQTEHIKAKGTPRHYILKAQPVPAVANTMTVRVPDECVGKTLLVSVWIEEPAA